MPAVCDSPTIRWWQYLILEPPQTKCICQQKRECKSFNRHHGHCTREEEEYQNKTILSKKISIGMLRVCGVKLTDSTALQTFPLECVASWSRTGLEHLSEKEGKKHTTSNQGMGAEHDKSRCTLHRVDGRFCASEDVVHMARGRKGVQNSLHHPIPRESQCSAAGSPHPEEMSSIRARKFAGRPLCPC